MDMPQVLFITSYPPRECGIATYSQDLISTLDNKFGTSFSIKVCALESGPGAYTYPDEVEYILDTSSSPEYLKMAGEINQNDHVKLVVLQHEFGFFHHHEGDLLKLLYELNKPVVIVFHTVLPHPDERLRKKVQHITTACGAIVVMTHRSAQILEEDYEVPAEKISVIAHGTHLVQHLSETYLKEKYGLAGRKVLTTFGLLSSGKSIETTLDALPSIIKTSPDIVFLVIGKTHPEVVKNEGENYRDMLEKRVTDLAIQDHVVFINQYLALPELLEYLQLTDIYLFTSSDPNQAVSGTFAYAMSCGCPIISTPIPHAKEVLTTDTGIIIDFRNSQQLADAVNKLLGDDPLRRNIGSNTLQKIVATAWENSAVAHAMLLERMAGKKIPLRYDLPPIKLDHIEKMTTGFGMIQFSKINQPDIESGYTLDDNARALIALCMHYELTGDESDVLYMQTYLNFIKYCLEPEGDFLNYVDKEMNFTSQNEVNLDDANGRAIWALGYVISRKPMLPATMVLKAGSIMKTALVRAENMHSTRAMAFVIKGLYYSHSTLNNPGNLILFNTLAKRLVQMYRHESDEGWEWFESYLTYANSILPEAMLYAWLLTDEPVYKDIAIASLNFLLSQIFNENGIEVISNKNWLKKGEKAGYFGEQPIDVAYTVMTLGKFYDVFGDEEYLKKLVIAFNWFSGQNRLHQVIYNPCTGGCYDGLEESHVNLNQGAESTISYLMARLTIQMYQVSERHREFRMRNHYNTKTKHRELVYSSNALPRALAQGIRVLQPGL